MNRSSTEEFLKVLDDPDSNSSEFIELLKDNELINSAEFCVDNISSSDLVNIDVNKPDIKEEPISNAGTNNSDYCFKSWAELDAQNIHLEITEQPSENKLRFRYECEGRSTGSLQGSSSDVTQKTYPTIKVVNYNDSPVVCVVSLVEAEQIELSNGKAGYRVHPHHLVGKDAKFKDGICSLEILPMKFAKGKPSPQEKSMEAIFPNLGIQCVRKKDALASLTDRKRIKVDPFKMGFDHAKSTLDLNCVRLCFQIFIRTSDKGFYQLRPVVSNIIKDRKTCSDLSIVDYSTDTSSFEGDEKVLLFCSKVLKDDIEVHFLHKDQHDNTVIAKGVFTPQDVYKQFGICLKTPPYLGARPHPSDLNTRIYTPMYLYRPKLDAFSDQVDFWYCNKQEKKVVENNKPSPPRNSPLQYSSQKRDRSNMVRNGINHYRVKSEPMNRVTLPPTTPIIVSEGAELSSGQILIPRKMKHNPLQSTAADSVFPHSPTNSSPQQSLATTTLSNFDVMSSPTQQIDGETRRTSTNNSDYDESSPPHIALNTTPTSNDHDSLPSSGSNEPWDADYSSISMDFLSNCSIKQDSVWSNNATFISQDIVKLENNGAGERPRHDDMLLPLIDVKWTNNITDELVTPNNDELTSTNFYSNN